MKLFYVHFIVSLIATSTLADVTENPMKVTLYYESYCPDCIGYIVNQLYGTWTSFKGKVLFDLVPFGNARQRYVDGHWEFDCQHGPPECEANKLHACAVKQACGDTGTIGCDVTKLGQVMDFIYCLVKKPDQLRGTKACAQDSGLNGDDIISCANGPQGDTLLNHYGNRTIAFRPRIEYVPTVAVNGKHDKAAEDNLVGEICKLQPQLCVPRFPEVISY